MALGLLAGMASSMIGGLINKNKRQQQLEDQQALNEQAAKLNYEYGEKAAKNAYERQLALYQRSYRDQSYSAMRGQMEDAGLSVGLMYGGSGAGGAGGATTGAPLGSTGGAQAGQASAAAESQMAQQKALEMGLSMLNMKADLKIKEAQVDEIKAQAEKARADAGLASESKITEMQRRDAFVEELKQRGMAQWMDNMTKYTHGALSSEIMNEEPDGNLYSKYENKIYGDFKINTRSLLNEREAVQILQAYSSHTSNQAAAKASEAIAKLNNERAEGYWQELLNATIQANSDKMRAEAAKLSAEFETGEYTNWKTWVDISKSVVGAVAGATAVGKIIKK